MFEQSGVSSAAAGNGDLRRSVCQVLDRRGGCVGTGFLVDGGLMVSCAHVIAKCVPFDGGMSTGPVMVRFPHLGDEVRTAEVVAASWRGPDDGDVAFLRLLEAPSDAPPLRLAERANIEGRVKVFGFPVNAPSRGHYGYGIVGDCLTSETGHSLVQLRDCTEITEGFSGAPAVDVRTGLVIGMVDSVSAPDRLLRGIETAYVTPSDRLRTLVADLPPAGVSPYRGLAHFTREDSAWFFGRGRAIDQVIRRLGAGGTPRLVALLGPSGSGKTSLVQAGVIPALAADALSGSRRWSAITARPGTDPVAELRAAGLVGVEDGLAQAVGRWLADHPEVDRIVLVLDPFEELFALSTLAVSRRKLLDQLLDLSDQQPQATVLLVMRDDFYSQLAATAPLLMGRIEQQLVNMPATLIREDLTLMIAEPAALAGVAVEPGLIDDILADAVASTPAASGDITADAEETAPTTVLPLLEFTLSELWEARSDGELTRDRYRKMGGLTGALAGRCDHIFGQLSPEHADIGRRLLIDLVEDPSDVHLQAPMTRRRRRLSQLPGPLRDNPLLSQVAAELADGRLVVSGRDLVTSEPTYELIHDSLLRHWGQLRRWLDSDRAFRTWRSRLEANQRQWADSAARAGGSPDNEQLLRGSAVDHAEQQLRERRADLPDHLVRYIEDSAWAERSRRDRDRRRRRIAAGFVAFLVLALLGLLVGNQQRQVALQQRRTADAQRRLADSRQVAAEAGLLHTTRPDLSMLLGVEAMRIASTNEARGQLLSEQAQRYAGALPVEKYLFAMAISSDGQTMAAATGDAVKLWDVSSHRLRATLKYRATGALAISPDGGIVAAADYNNRVQLWDARNSYSELQALTVPTKLIRDIAFSPDSKSLAIAADGGSVQLLRLADGSMLQTFTSHPGEVTDKVLFDPVDGNILATVGGHQTAKLWDIRTPPTLLATFPANSNSVYSTALAFSPDGETVATASTDHTATLWSTRTHTLVATLTGHDSGVNGIAFRPDGRILATASGDHTVILWDAGTGQGLVRLPRQAGTISGVAFSSDGVLATKSEGSIQFWETRRRLLKGPFRVVGATYSPDGQTLATAIAGGSVDLWDSRTQRLTKTLPGPSGGGIGGNVRMAFSPDSRALASIGGTSARLWDVKTGTLMAEAKLTDVDFLISVAFSPTGHTVAMSGLPGPIRLWNVANNQVTAMEKEAADFAGYSRLIYTHDRKYIIASGAPIGLWDIATGRRVGSFENPTSTSGTTIRSLALSADGRVLAGGYTDGTIVLWDVGTRRILQHQLNELGGHTGAINDIAFSQDDAILATAGDDRTIKLWDLAHSHSLLASLAGHIQPVNGLGFNRQDGSLASAGDDAVILWDLDSRRVAVEICRKLTANLSQRDWERYIPDVPYSSVCS